MASGDAERIFTGIAGSYDRVATVLSLGQDPRWRRALVDAIDARPTDRVLDVATGTGMVAQALRDRFGCTVVGLDQSPDMLRIARTRDGVFETIVEGRAESLPFTDAAFDHLTFTYLLRYVDDPAATMRELARVVKPGGRVAMVEFGARERRSTRGRSSGCPRRRCRSCGARAAAGPLALTPVPG
jgi:demethylmenaquinone methyltransferase / 2-methoxy-6-polyprenyl-1,4-benzoquinol methylase